MDAWYYRIIVACDTVQYQKGDVRTIWVHFPATYVSVVHSTWPSRAMWQTHVPTFNKWHQEEEEEKKKKKVMLHMLIHGARRGCGLTSLVVCVNDKFRYIRERHVTIRSEIWTTNILSLGFRDNRECVTLRGLILQSVWCTSIHLYVIILWFEIHGWHTVCVNNRVCVKMSLAWSIIRSIRFWIGMTCFRQFGEVFFELLGLKDKVIQNGACVFWEVYYEVLKNFLF